MRRIVAWALPACLSVCCANAGELRDDPEGTGGFSGEGVSGTGNASAGTAGVGGLAAGGSAGTSAQAGAAGASGDAGQSGGSAGDGGPSAAGASGGAGAGAGGSAGNAGSGGSAGMGPQCSGTEKLCGLSCVTPNPSVGCNLTDCTRCPDPPANATATCNGTNCDFACNSGFSRTGNSCIRDCVAANCPQVCLPVVQWTCCQTDGSCGCQGLITACH